MKRICLLLFLLLPLCALAEEAPLNLALFAPTAPLPSVEARFAYVDGVAGRLSRAGVRAQGRVYGRAADLEAAIRRGQVDLAIVDAVYLAERNLGYPILASATSSGETSLRWGLYALSSGKGSMLELAGASLAWAQVGSREPVFLDNVLLDGEVRVGQFFSLRPPAPDVAAAVSEVVLRRADCVFAPESVATGKGLRRVYDAGKVPTPALVQVAARLDRGLLSRLREALVSGSDPGPLDGFRAASAETYRGLRARVSGRALRRFIMAEPQPLLTAVRGDVLVREEGAPVLLPLKGLLTVPQGAP